MSMLSQNLKKTIQNMHTIPWKLYLSVLLTHLLPTIYVTIRIYFLGDLPSDWGVNIASQLVWISLVLEVIQEGLILPLFYIIGKTSKDRNETINKVKTGLLITIGIHVLILAIVGIFTPAFVRAMAQNPALQDATVVYIRLELISLLIQSVFKFLFILFIIYDQRVTIYLLLLVQMIGTVILDTFFVSSFSFSLNLGVNGIAYSNIIIYSLLVGMSIYRAIRTFKLTKKDWRVHTSFTWLKEWGRVGGYSAMDSFIRNLFYMVFIIRMMNIIAEQGTYWVANGFIWSWLLLLVYPLTDIIKQKIATTLPEKLKGFLNPYYLFSTIIVLLWFLTMPGWMWFITKVLNAAEPQTVFRLVLLLLPAYISFVYNTVADALFYAIGKTESLAIQTILTNISVYGIAFILFITGNFIPTLYSIAILFSIGIVIDGILTFILLRYYIRKYEMNSTH
ncbi:MAG: hypothetical protein JW776_16865 [Candidatus Lokiarchaeota archaeon]|nr:hypothetical protein [Candidatus Lokiarchaeota archaeon]